MVGIVLIAAGWGKITAPEATERVLSFAAFPPPWPQVVMGVLPGLEVAFGLALLVGWSSRMLLGCAVALLLIFTGFLTYLAFARYGGDCGCVGPVIDRWSGGSPLAGIARNLVLLALLAWPATLAFRARTSPDSHPRLGPGASTARSVGLLLAVLMPIWSQAQEHEPQKVRRPTLSDPWSPRFESQLRTVFGDRIVIAIAEWFDMTDDQTVVLQALRDDHQAKFDAFVEEVAPTWQPLEDAMQALPRSTMARTKAHVDYEIAVAEIADRQETLDMEFLSVIQSILNAAQTERWDEFRMWLNRQRWCGRAGWYLEQPVDLIALLQEIERRFPDEAGAVPVEIVQDYARQMDGALREIVAFSIDGSRNRIRNEMDRLHTDGERTWLGPWSDPTRTERENKQRLSLNQAVRDLNHRYATIFASSMPEPHATAWRRLYRESVLSRVDYDSSLSDETNDYIIKAIKGTPRRDRIIADIGELVLDLDADQRTAIDDLTAQRDGSLDAAFKRVVAAHDEFADSSFRGVGSQGRVELEAKYRESLETFADIERRSIETILAVLTPEQRALVEDRVQHDD